MCEKLVDQESALSGGSRACHGAWMAAIRRRRELPKISRANSQKVLTVPVELADETLTSVDAEDLQMRQKHTAGDVDSIAASLILERYLAEHPAEERECLTCIPLTRNNGGESRGSHGCCWCVALFVLLSVAATVAVWRYYEQTLKPVSAQASTQTVTDRIWFVAARNRRFAPRQRAHPQRVDVPGVCPARKPGGRPAGWYI